MTFESFIVWCSQVLFVFSVTVPIVLIPLALAALIREEIRDLRGGR